MCAGEIITIIAATLSCTLKQTCKLDLHIKIGAERANEWLRLNNALFQPARKLDSALIFRERKKLISDTMRRRASSLWESSRMNIYPCAPTNYSPVVDAAAWEEGLRLSRAPLCLLFVLLQRRSSSQTIPQVSKQNLTLHRKMNLRATFPRKIICIQELNYCLGYKNALIYFSFSMMSWFYNMMCNFSLR
jgi:hypothetical protein